MEVDDLEQQLLSQFRSLATSDRDVLIAQFQKLIDGQMTERGCEFFLDMSDWNLQAAACAYYDYQGHNQSLPEMSLVEDVTIGEGESITPSTPFSKVWRLQNRGTEAWPPGCSINFCLGHKFGGIDYLALPSLESGEVTEVRVSMVSPPESGIFSGQWRMKTAAGNICGDIIWVIISVEVNGILGVTQQMNELPIGQKFGFNSHINPFAPPTCQTLQILNNSHDSLTNSNSLSPIKQPDSTSGHAAPPPSPMNSQFGTALQFHNSLLTQLNQETILPLKEEATDMNSTDDHYYS